jgi:hypothetical protein
MGDTSVLTTAITAVAPLLGVAVGATLQYLYGRSAEARRHERELRLNAYSEYLRSVGEMEALRSDASPVQRSEVVGRAIGAKARVCVHGSSAAVSVLARFEGATGDGLTREKRAALLAFIVTVRAEMAATRDVNATDIELILLGRGTA